MLLYNVQHLPLKQSSTQTQLVPCTVQLLLLLSLLSSLLLLLYILKEYYYCYFCCHRYYYRHHLFYYSCHYHHYFGFLAHGWELFLAGTHREAGKSDCVFVITKLAVFFIYIHYRPFYFPHCCLTTYTVNETQFWTQVRRQVKNGSIHLLYCSPGWPSSICEKFVVYSIVVLL